MTRTLHTTRSLITFAVIALAAAACGTTAGGGGGGGVQTVGGAPSTACNAAVHNEGCFNGKRVKCDAAGTWVEIAACGTGQYCAELADPAAPNTGKKVSECKDIPVNTVADAGGTGGDAVADAVADAGPKKTPAEEVTCTQQKCPSEFAACMAYAPCATLMSCVKLCTDETCADACGAKMPQNDEKVFGLIIALGTCGEKTGCIVDEPVTQPSCGDGKCDDAETPTTCPADCKVDGPKCGDEKCEAGETATSCPSDCKADGPKCGNEQCETGETPATCPADCKVDGPKCGNEKCESGETPASCPSDCQSAGKCGDGQCVSPESATTCLIDCDSTYSAEVYCAKTKCASQYAACANAPACLAGVECLAKCEKADAGTSCAQGCISAAGSSLSVLMALGECADSACGGGSTPQCSESKPCPSGKTCIEGTCQTSTIPECSASKPCPSGKKCASGACVPDGGTSGSCVGKCGKFEEGASCQCDDQCKQYNDCCPDIATACPSP